MTGSPEYSFNPDLGINAEFAGIEMAADLTHSISHGFTRETGRELSIDERATIQDMLAPGLAHFHSLAEQAGELAGEGDIMGAFSLMGGIESARELLGDEIVDELLAELDKKPDTIS